MSNWIILVIISQFIAAFVALVDKYIVTSKKVSKPFIYSFYVCILSSLGVLAFLMSWIDIPFLDFRFPSFSNIEYPSIKVALISISIGATFFYALLYLFASFKRSDASDVVPVVGGISAISAFILSFFLLDTNLTSNFLIGSILLVVGTFLISRLRFNFHTILFSIISGVLFGVQAILTKILFNSTSFDNGFFWSRIGLFLFALIIFFIPKYNLKIRGQSKGTSKRGGILIIGNKLLAGIAGILSLRAIDLGNVYVVQALGGLQFVFLLFLSILIGNFTPKDFGENFTKKDLFHKSISIILITIGFIFLFI